MQPDSDTLTVAVEFTPYDHSVTRYVLRVQDNPFWANEYCYCAICRLVQWQASERAFHCVAVGLARQKIRLAHKGRDLARGRMAIQALWRRDLRDLPHQHNGYFVGKA